MQRIQIWATEDNIAVELPDGQYLTFPFHEPARLVAFLRNEERRTRAKGNVLRDLEREQRAREWAAAWRAKGEETRAAEERRKSRDAKGLVRRADKAQERKEQLALLKLVGL